MEFDMERQSIENLAEKACAEINCRLYHIEWQSQSLRVYADKTQKNIQLSDCEKISKRLKFFLMAEGLNRGLSLEVSSPGLERKLIQPWHFSSAVGKIIKFQYTSEKPGKKSFSGELTQVDDKGIILDHKQFFDFDSIQEAHLVFQHST